MLLRILQRDLKRKKTMNMILLLFIVLSTMFLSGSIGNLVKIQGAVNHFIEVSNVPDFFVLSVGKEEEDVIDTFLKKEETVAEYEKVRNMNVDEEDIEIISRQDKEWTQDYERSNTLSIQGNDQNFCKVYDTQDELLELKSGEIALSKVEAVKNHLQIGDKLKITLGDVSQTFTVKAITKDAVFGSSMMGYKRHFISMEDFEKFAVDTEYPYTKIYSVNYKENMGETFQKHYRDQNFQVISNIEKATISLCYVFDMLIAAILIVVSIALILIAFLVLRFTILFTLQEDYKEIGIMKAIGIKPRGIQNIYLVKYLMLSLVGAVIGLILGFPCGEFLLKQAIVNMVVGQTKEEFALHLIAAAAVVLVVLLFCNRCTGKLKKFSAIDAIRNGSNGESFSNRYGNVSKHKRLPLPVYLAFNDIRCNLKRYIILVITFCIGTMMVLIPLEAGSTLTDDTIVSQFGMSPADVFADTGRGAHYVAQKEKSVIEKDLEEIETKIKQEGYHGTAGVLAGFAINMKHGKDGNMEMVYAYQNVGHRKNQLELIDGVEPKLKDEIVVTEIMLDKIGANIGDTVQIAFGEVEKNYLVTGSYQTMMNMGYGCYFSPEEDLDYQFFAGNNAIQIDIEELEEEEAIEKVKEWYPDWKVYNGVKYLDTMVGGITQQINGTVRLITAIVLMINVLITILMMKTFLAKERGDVALLKSLGFKDGSIRKIHVARIVLILAFSIILGTLLSHLLSPCILGPIFKMMGGSNIKLSQNVLIAYMIVPFILLTITGSTAFLCTGEVRKVEAREVNCME